MVQLQQDRNIICVTNRSLCGDISVFFDKIQSISEASPYAVILREKDLSEKDYLSLALRVSTLCYASGTRFFVHNFPKVALMCSADGLHMPLHRLKEYIDNSHEEAAQLLTGLHHLGVTVWKMHCLPRVSVAIT